MESASSSPTQVLFQRIIIDSNFYALLEESGFAKKLPEIVSVCKARKIKVVSPRSVIESDLPRRYREIRPLIPKSVTLANVNRNTKKWKQLAVKAIQAHLIRADKDPADIDVLAIAQFFRDKGEFVAVVSDDEGIIRAIREFEGFDGIEGLSNGAFLSILAALVPEEKQEEFDELVMRIFKLSWSYKRKSRSYIDLQLLINDLEDLTKYIRKASQVEGIRKRRTKKTPTKSTAKKTKRQLQPAEPLTIDDVIEQINPILQQCHLAQEQGNVYLLETHLKLLGIKIQEILGHPLSMEKEKIIQTFVIAELLQFHLWLLQRYLDQNSLFAALLHAQSIVSYHFLTKSQAEAIEDILVLQSLISILFGQLQLARYSINAIEFDKKTELPVTIVFGKIINDIAQGDIEEAKAFFASHVKNDVPMIDALYRYGIEAYIRGQKLLSLELLQFVIHYLTENNINANPQKYAKTLFIFSRIHEKHLNTDILKKLTDILGKEAVDNTSKRIPKKLKVTNPLTINIHFEKKPHPLHGPYIILDRKKNPQQDQLELIVWNEPLKSVWKLVFSADFEVAIRDALSFEIRSTVIKSVKARTKNDPPFIRGVISVENPVIGVRAIKTILSSDVSFSE